LMWSRSQVRDRRWRPGKTQAGSRSRTRSAIRSGGSWPSTALTALAASARRRASSAPGHDPAPPTAREGVAAGSWSWLYPSTGHRPCGVVFCPCPQGETKKFETSGEGLGPPPPRAPQASGDPTTAGEGDADPPPTATSISRSGVRDRVHPGGFETGVERPPRPAGQGPWSRQARPTGRAGISTGSTDDGPAAGVVSMRISIRGGGGGRRTISFDRRGA